MPLKKNYGRGPFTFVLEKIADKSCFLTSVVLQQSTPTNYYPEKFHNDPVLLKISEKDQLLSWKSPRQPTTT